MTESFVDQLDGFNLWLGLRFAVLARLRFLTQGLSAVLAFIGLKILRTDVIKIPILVALAGVVGILTIAIAASFLQPSRAENRQRLVAPCQGLHEVA